MRVSYKKKELCFTKRILLLVETIFHNDKNMKCTSIYALVFIEVSTGVRILLCFSSQ